MPVIQVFTSAELESFRKGGKILRACLDMLADAARPGVTTGELDRLAEAFIRDHDGEPSFLGYNGFPATLCTSINEECVHGIPGPRALEEGDILSIDCGVLFDGFHTDACRTLPMGEISADARRLLATAEAALARAVRTLRAGIHVGDLSAAIQEEIGRGGCTPVRSLTGHGVGRSLHQYPDIPNHGKAGTGPVFPAGAVVAVEPIVSLGSADVVQAEDGWTLITKDRSLAAHAEHTLHVMDGGCEVIA